MDNNKIFSKIEFDVNLSCKNCATAIENSLSKLPDINYLDINVEKQSVLVETSLPSLTIKEAIENTGKRAVLKGFGSNSLGSAVAELKSSPIYGVIRFHQVNEDLCVIDGTIDGLPPGEHGLHVHEYGDLSDLPLSIGPHFNPTESKHGGRDHKERHYGDLGNINADSKGRSSFRIEDPIIKVYDIIGRSISVSSNKDDLGCGANDLSKIDGNSGISLACAIIARSAGLFQNPKRICQCDGISIWDESASVMSSL